MNVRYLECEIVLPHSDCRVRECPDDATRIFELLGRLGLVWQAYQFVKYATGQVQGKIDHLREELSREALRFSHDPEAMLELAEFIFIARPKTPFST